MTSMNEVFSKFSNVKQVGLNQWQASCPAHDDDHESLSISTAVDDRILIHCHAGCTTQEVCSAVGLPMRDLFSKTSASAKPAETAQKDGYPRHRPKKKGQIYPTAEAGIAALEHVHGPCVAQWAYENPEGAVVGRVLRWNRPDGSKTFLPVSRYADGWRIAGMPKPRPLYRLSGLANAKRVYITEGEKCAEAARSLGLTATCSVHGAKSANETDWSPLAGKEIIVLPDHDGAGQQYAETVIGILENLRPAPTIKIVELPGLPPKGDIDDFIQKAITTKENNDDVPA
ncbi:MAG: hypothetical protein ABFC77_16265 [Thermoguttaceae bacterium]